MALLDSTPHTDELVTATGGVRSDLPAPGAPTTIDSGALDDIAGGIIDCILTWPPQRPDGQPRPDGLPLPLPSPLPGPLPSPLPGQVPGQAGQL